MGGGSGHLPRSDSAGREQEDTLLVSEDGGILCGLGNDAFGLVPLALLLLENCGHD